MQPSSQWRRQAADDTSVHVLALSSATFAEMDVSDDSQVPVSLIVTVRDDRPGLAELLDAIAEQAEMPDEIVVVDGGSKDGTLEELDGARSEAAAGPGVRRPGREHRRRAKHRRARSAPRLDRVHGCRAVARFRGWLAALQAGERVADIAAGTFVVEGETPLDRAVACAHYPVLEEVHDDDPLVRLAHRLFGRDFRAEQAGGRSMAFSRAAWEAAGGFREHVYAGEDLAFSAAAVELGFRATLAEEATVRWRPRTTWVENARMFATYTRGDIRTKGRARHLARLAAWTAGPWLFAEGRPRREGARSLPGRPPTCGSRCAGRGARLPPSEWWRVPALVALKDLSQLGGAGLGVVDAIRGVPQPRPHR